LEEFVGTVRPRCADGSGHHPPRTATVAVLHSGVNFINALQAAFVRKDPKSAKRLTTYCFFALLGSRFVKAACRTLIKLTAGVNFIKIPQQLLRQ